MKINVNWLGEGFQFEGLNNKGGKVAIDGSVFENGLSPMQLLLAGIGGCSAIDVVSILEKQKQNLESLSVEVDGDKQSTGSYSEFKTIHMHFTFSGDLDPNKVQKALDLSIQKYCSVSKALEKTSEISYDFEIIG